MQTKHLLVRQWLVCLVFAAVVLVPLTGEAKRKRRGSRGNMPASWQWPPSPEMRRNGKSCLGDLDALGVAWKKARATRRIATPIVVPTMEFGRVKLTSIFRKPPFVMDCHLALALARHSEVMHALGVRELRFTSIHSYRRIIRKGYRGNALSRHALGLAMDVYEVVLADGTKLVVERDYADSETLHELEAAVNATGAFRTLLTPGSDPRSHYDHFHFEARFPQPPQPDPTGQLTAVPLSPQ